MAHILVVEDDESISDWISDYLTNHDYEVSIANRGDYAVDLIGEDNPDLVLLDIMLPEKDGFQVCKEVREFYAAPILMITACAEEADEVRGFELGADDYITKPLRLRPLLARIQALLKRDKPEEGNPHVLVFGNFSIDSLTQKVKINGIEVSLTSHELNLLWQMASNANIVVSRDELIREQRGFDYDGVDRSIDVRISRLRKKMSRQVDCPFEIKTIWGKGYLFTLNKKLRPSAPGG